MNSSEALQDPVQRAAALLRTSQRAVALTGAGISTPSGIPDFRSARSGLWERDNPMEVASLPVFRRRPERFYGWLRPLAAAMWQAKPNPAHRALAALEAAGKLRAVITQNIDGLHQAAGSQNVLELHGSLRELSCPKCFTRFPVEGFITPFLENGALPLCRECHAVLKPGIVLFEELLPADVWAQAEVYSRECDLMLVVGSSLEVFPAASLPEYAVEAGARLIINNLTPTYLDADAELVLHADLAEVLPKIAAAVL